MNQWVNLHALWQILIAGLVCGAGLPAVFALGLRGLSMPGRPHPTSSSDDSHVVGGNPVGLAMAAICFASVLAAIGWGIYFIVTGG